MSRRITGLETEYGCLVDAQMQPREVLPRIGYAKQAAEWICQGQPIAESR